MKRLQKEIDSEITRLREFKKKIPHYSAFGDDNWEPIDAQINILTGKKRYSDYENAEYNIESAAYDASEWLSGNLESLTDED